MPYNYDKATATAKKIIKKFGSDGAFVKKGSTGGFDAEGNVKADVEDIIIEGIITPLVKFKVHEVDGKSIINGDGWVFFSADTLPEIGYQTAVNGKTFRVVDSYVLSSVEGVTVYQKLQLRS
jgi:hypothetical protein